MDSARPQSADAEEVPVTLCQNITKTGQKCKNPAVRICTTGEHKNMVFCGSYHQGLPKNPNDYKDFAVQEPPGFNGETDHVSLPKTGPKLGSRPSSANRGKKIKEQFKKGIDPDKSTRHLRSATASQQADERKKAVCTKRGLNVNPTPRTFPPKGDQKAFSEKVKQNAKKLNDGKSPFVPSHSETQEEEMGGCDLDARAEGSSSKNDDENVPKKKTNGNVDDSKPGQEEEIGDSDAENKPAQGDATTGDAKKTIPASSSNGGGVYERMSKGQRAHPTHPKPVPNVSDAPPKPTTSNTPKTSNHGEKFINMIGSQLEGLNLTPNVQKEAEKMLLSAKLQVHMGMGITPKTEQYFEKLIAQRE